MEIAYNEVLDEVKTAHDLRIGATNHTKLSR